MSLPAIYRYDAIDRAFVHERVAEYRSQLARYLAGELSEDEFRPLRLRNGLYIQRHAPMFRIAVPYGVLSAQQLRTLAQIAATYDRGYLHFTTRHNAQFNWIPIEQTADVLALLADVDMHSIQTSGNCVRNVTTDEYAGLAPDEDVDPRPFAEILRQWSTFHPEFNYLPRKFKIAIHGAREDRAATAFHDIGLTLWRDPAGALRLRVLVGGGMGRTPMVGTVIRDDLEWRHMLSYVEAILRVYNLHGRRDNSFKARIKILVKALGAAEFTRQVDEQWALLRNGPATLLQQEVDRVAAHFQLPDTRSDALHTAEHIEPQEQAAFNRWQARAVRPQRDGRNAVALSLKKTGVAPGDISAAQMLAAADWSERFGLSELRVSHEQNLIIPHVATADLPALWRAARAQGLATPNLGLLSDLICCPGGDFCSLANAKSIPIAEAVQRRFDDLDYQHDIGELNLNISGCMNSCGHHHVGHIGILGVDKDGSEWYQVSIGGADGSSLSHGRAAVGRILGPSFEADAVPGVVAQLLDTYVEQREDGERFIDTVARIGIEPFKTRVYGATPRAQREIAHV
jgi:sulfite reductase (NADPH) hemoprotein beta-component